MAKPRGVMKATGGVADAARTERKTLNELLRGR